jgi:hypothetical protein
LLLGECGLDEALEVFARFHRVGNPAKYVVEVLVGHVPEETGVFRAKRFKPDNRTFELEGRGDV